MKRTALFPGSFDPVTKGHIDVILRASKVFSHLFILVQNSLAKKSLFSVEERCQILEDSLKGMDSGISVISGGERLTVDILKEVQAHFLIRGLRSAADFERERDIFSLNYDLAEVDTVFFCSLAKHSHLSSSLVKEIVKYGSGENIRAYLPDPSFEALKEKKAKGTL